MLDDVRILPLDEHLLLWRCLHSGPLSRQNLDHPPEGAGIPWSALRERNIPLLRRLVATYESCALLAWAGDEVVGMLRYYPRAIAQLPEAGGLCLQQTHPSGPSEELIRRRFSPPTELLDRTLSVHCLMVGSPSRQENPYLRKGLGTAMARELIQWAADRGWSAIEATAYQDLPVIYAITGQTGRSFWRRLGFEEIVEEVEPGFEEAEGLLQVVHAQAASQGLTQEQAVKRFIMRLDL